MDDDPITMSLDVLVELTQRDYLRAATAGYYRLFPPWAFPDRNPMPNLVLFPRLEAARTAGLTARGRCRDAWAVLAHGASLDDGYDDDY